jgi:hypothetical protein
MAATIPTVPIHHYSIVRVEFWVTRGIDRNACLFQQHRFAGVGISDFDTVEFSNGDSEDPVHDCVLWLIERQEFLQAPPTKAYLFPSVKSAVMARARGSYIQRTVAVTPEELVDIEEQRYAFEHGRARTPEVTLPEPMPRDYSPVAVA